MTGGGTSPVVRLAGVGKTFGAAAAAGRGAGRHQPRDRPGRVRVADRPVRVRQVDAAAAHRRPDRGNRRDRRGQRQAGAPGAPRSRLRDGLPVAGPLRVADVEDNVRLPLELFGQRPRSQARAGAARCSSWWASPISPGTIPTSCRAGCSSASPSPGRWPSRPALLLMDEPFGALDEMTRERMNSEVLSIWERTGITVVFVTHSIPEAVFLSSRVAVMSARPGRITRLVDVDLPRPRGLETRESPRYFNLITEVREALRGGEGAAARRRSRRRSGPRPRAASAEDAGAPTATSRRSLILVGDPRRPGGLRAGRRRQGVHPAGAVGDLGGPGRELDRGVPHLPGGPGDAHRGSRRARHRNRRWGWSWRSASRASRARGTRSCRWRWRSTPSRSSPSPRSPTTGSASSAPSRRWRSPASLVFFPIMINVLRGLTDVDPSALELMRSYAASPRRGDPRGCGSRTRCPSS